jgi:hypothetical protein
MIVPTIDQNSLRTWTSVWEVGNPLRSFKISPVHTSSDTRLGINRPENWQGQTSHQ